MGDNNKYFGSDLGRHLNVGERAFTDVLFQPHHPPISEEFNLQKDINKEERRKILQGSMPSGFLMSPGQHASDFKTDKRASNLFWMGSNESGGDEDMVWAMVNGWTIPVAGTESSDPRNKIKLPPPPSSSSSSDVNFIFLEAWQVPVKPGGTTYKPSQDRVWRFGNVDYGGANPKHQIEDPRVGDETSERIQTQYRIRVIDSHDPHAHPLGFNASIKPQGPLSSPLSTSNSAYEYENMGQKLGDPGLWRAGVKNNISDDGTNLLSQSDLKTLDGFVYAVPIAFVFRRAEGNWGLANQNSAVNRFSGASDRADAKVLEDVQLDQDISHDDTSFDVNIQVSSTEFASSGGLLQVGDEIIEYSGWSGTTVTVSNRGAKDTHAASHSQNDSVYRVSGHPENLFSDEIADEDIYDLRHAVSLGGFDYDSLLESNFEDLIRGDLQTQWKSEKNNKGTKHWQVDFLSTNSVSGSLGNSVEERDRPDGHRRIFSDAATPQPNNMAVFPDGSATLSLGQQKYDFNPAGSAVKTDSGNWRRGDVIEIPLDQFRDTFNTQKKVRFVHPKEYEHSPATPLEIEFGDTNPDNGTSLLTGPIDAHRDSNDEAHMVVLGENPGTVSSSYLSGSNDDVSFDTTSPVSTIEVSNVDFGDQPSSINGQKVGDWLADQDAWIVFKVGTGISTLDRHGAFKIAGTASSGNYSGSGLKVLAPEDLGEDCSFGNDSTESSVDWKIRMESCTEDDENLIVSLAKGQSGSPDQFSSRQLHLNFSLLYHPNQGLSRAPDQGHSVWMEKNSGSSVSYLREDTFENEAGSSQRTMKKFPTRPLENYPFDPTSLTKKNPRDRSTGREQTWAEAYEDPGSKSLLVQPVQDITMIQFDDTDQSNISYTSPGGNAPYNFNLGNSEASISMKLEYLPRKGRVDVPVVDSQTTSGPAYGVNTAFVSSTSTGFNDHIVKNRHIGLYDPVNTSLPSDYNTSDSLSNISSDPNAPNEQALISQFYDEDGVRGIELPPHFGMARLFGIYTLQDYIDHGSEFQQGANSEWRQKKSNHSGRNLLKTHHDRRSILINDTSWVVPEDTIDTSAFSGKLKDQQLVYEFAPFMFDSFSGSHVRVHLHNAPNAPGSERTVRMLINGPVAAQEDLYAVSERVPYQGNPSGTRPASTSSSGNLDWGDYSFKDQADTSSEMNDLTTDLDIDDARLEEPRRLDVITSLPFATSLGTGRISGEFTEGSFTDVGYLDPTDFPDISSRRPVKSRGLYERFEDNVLSSQESTSKVASDLIGLSERLPMGLYGSDHQMMGEAFYGDQRRFWEASDSSEDGLFDVDRDGKMRQGQSESSGQWVFSDGTGKPSYSNSNNLYRTYRGGVVSEMADDKQAHPVMATGGQVYKEYPFVKDVETEFLEEMESQNFNISSSNRTDIKKNLRKKFRKRRQIHGAVLFGVAVLVRTRQESATSNNILVNPGGELQMVVLTGLSLGTDAPLDLLESGTVDREHLQLKIQQSPVGTGEGYQAADRFRLKGRPLEKKTRGPKEGEDVSLYRFRD